MICPACGARNGERATWCSQCFTVLDGPPPGPAGAAPSGPAGAVPPPPPPAAAVDTPAATSGGKPGGGGPPERDVRVRDDQVEWRCTVCGGWSSLLEEACLGCGARRLGFTPAEVAAPSVPRVGVTVSLLASALLPGLGHLLRGVLGLGLAVLLLWLLWAGGALASRGGAAPLTAVLVLAAALLWAVSLLDLQRRTTDAEPVLTGRLLAWGTVGVTGLLVLAAIGGGLSRGG
ncbi:MAG: hypothetical protein ACNA8R_11425 [Nitriliruptoraceae bacterium]